MVTSNLTAGAEKHQFNNAYKFWGERWWWDKKERARFEAIIEGASQRRKIGKHVRVNPATRTIFVAATGSKKHLQSRVAAADA